MEIVREGTTTPVLKLVLLQSNRLADVVWAMSSGLCRSCYRSFLSRRGSRASKLSSPNHGDKRLEDSQLPSHKPHVLAKNHHLLSVVFCDRDGRKALVGRDKMNSLVEFLFKGAGRRPRIAAELIWTGVSTFCWTS